MNRFLKKGAARKLPLFFFLISLWLTACGSPEDAAATATANAVANAAATLAALPPPAAEVPIIDGDGQQQASQPGPLWVLLSGVDEHGLVAEHEVGLLAGPDPAGVSGSTVHSGSAVYVLAIRQGGPQNLQRFYQVQALNGLRGWVSDYYVRRVVYLYDETAETVALYDAPDGELLTEVVNISPMVLKETADTVWWRVESPDGVVNGWVSFEFIKESPELEFLRQQQHGHE